MDLEGNVVSVGKWKLGQPNGGAFQQCISLVGIENDEFYYDQSCHRQKQI